MPGCGSRTCVVRSTGRDRSAARPSRAACVICHSNGAYAHAYQYCKGLGETDLSSTEAGHRLAIIHRQRHCVVIPDQHSPSRAHEWLYDCNRGDLFICVHYLLVASASELFLSLRSNLSASLSALNAVFEILYMRVRAGYAIKIRCIGVRNCVQKLGICMSFQWVDTPFSLPAVRRGPLCVLPGIHGATAHPK